MDGVYDPATANGRLLLGLKGTISKLELHKIKSRVTTGRTAKAQRGDLVAQRPANSAPLRLGHEGSRSRGATTPVALRDLPESADDRASYAGLCGPWLDTVSP
ncbi:hypothetical protein [Bradyrhizobium sp. CCBAU 11434]|uniref:hypothetical protein n=1 Tax=Bradyrhizobium sp. CCBAU 11434 TaxID=1630885 RepID=UPI002306ACE3|nr:hypothetical protein [Bradyrhizobium sp. CCBAU 11434]